MMWIQKKRQVHFSGKVHKKEKGKERAIGGGGTGHLLHFRKLELQCPTKSFVHSALTLQPFLITVPVTTLPCPQSTKTPWLFLSDRCLLIPLLRENEILKSKEWHFHLCSVQQRMGCHSQMQLLVPGILQPRGIQFLGPARGPCSKPPDYLHTNKIQIGWEVFLFK